jgi:hypothetical protein
MRYMLTLTEPGHYERWAALSDADRQAVFAAFERFDAAVTERGGKVVGGEGLAGPDQARTVGPGTPGARTVTEGPFAESAEQIGGFYVIDVPDLDAALELAQLLPEDFTIEVRPVVSG